ncbi:RNA polymerase sigma-32 factor [Xanthomonas oryzae pv. oryzae KACC 10331]|uniref:RNA polymerase sigma factor RpoH n=5 Tax=Xanthomonas TaxID=338 RepID=Q5GUS3_XANOR|nr:RNA polymerase sigma-32 factor [Xanthomonas oryzae pv. oryzae KACC 10331]
MLSCRTTVTQKARTFYKWNAGNSFCTRQSNSSTAKMVPMNQTTSTALVANNLPIPSALGSLDAYIGAVHQIPVLSVDEEQNLARRFRDELDLDAARELVHSHLRFVVHVARGYNGYGLPLGDLIQEGNIGLMKAVKRFDPDMGVRLVSFAVHWIRAEMHEFILKNWRIVKVATTKAQRKLFFNLRKSKTRLGWLNASEVTAVAKDLNVSEREVMEMESRLSGRDIGFDASSDEDDDHGPPSPVSYLVANEEDPSQAYERHDSEDNQLQLLREGMAGLDTRSRDIVKRRWLDSDSKVTLQELADEYGVSAERIRQIEANALKKMKALFVA